MIDIIAGGIGLWLVARLVKDMFATPAKPVYTKTVTTWYPNGDRVVTTSHNPADKI